MIRLLPAIFLVLTATGAQAQQQPREHDACTRDATRFCRAHLDEGDQAVLACLKEHRARLSKACEKTLSEHGQ
jgi:Cysteine rich repeat